MENTKKTKTESRFLSIKDFADIFNITRQTVWMLVLKQKINAIHLNGANRWLIPKSEVENYIKACEESTRKDYFARGDWFNNR
jgi:excisionase family DNA binding protein